MAQVSTGMGLAILGTCILGAAALTSHKFGGEAFAQGTGTERRIVSASVFPVSAYVDNANGQVLVATRIWSDNAIEARVLGLPRLSVTGEGLRGQWMMNNGWSAYGPCAWLTVDNGTSGFRPLTDVDMSGETDAGDISQVLLDFNTRSEDLPPPPIDCTINSPR